MIAGKVWGLTELIESNGSLEFHRIMATAGGVCSKHIHEFKWNGFFVTSGKLLIRVWQKDYDLVDETILGPGEYTKVKPGVYHQFECLEDCEAFELYWAEFSGNDIVRENSGHAKPTPEGLDTQKQASINGDRVSIDMYKKAVEMTRENNAKYDRG